MVYNMINRIKLKIKKCRIAFRMYMIARTLKKIDKQVKKKVS